MKAKTFNNDLCQHLSIAIFYIEKRLTHNYCKFYKWGDLSIYGSRQKFIRQNMKGVGTFIKLGIHTLMNMNKRTKSRNIKQDNKLPNTKNYSTLQVIYIFVSICCVFKYWENFRVLFRVNLIVAELQTEILFFKKMCIINLQLRTSQFKIQFFTDFPLFTFSIHE